MYACECSTVSVLIIVDWTKSSSSILMYSKKKKKEIKKATPHEWSEFSYGINKISII